MLSSLGALGYTVEWKVINAADYGMPQRRRRVFILAYKEGTELHRLSIRSSDSKWIGNNSPMAKAFPGVPEAVEKGVVLGDLDEISQHFNLKGRLSPFKTCGVYRQGEFSTANYTPVYDGPVQCLEDVLLPLENVSKEYFITKKDLDHPTKGWRYQKGAKRIERTNAAGKAYVFSEGALTFPDALDRPSRTIITGEGGVAPSRFKHVVEQEGRFRRLTPMELERLNMFPDDHTKLEGISDTKRAFFMGNALVTGVVERIAVQLEGFI
jgi:DNA (cytosine-5)-methyltransferase 1